MWLDISLVCQDADVALLISLVAFLFLGVGRTGYCFVPVESSLDS